MENIQLYIAPLKETKKNIIFNGKNGDILQDMETI